MGLRGRREREVEERRWADIAHLLRADEHRLTFAVWAQDPAAPPRRNRYGVVYLTDRRVIIGYDLDRRQRHLIGGCQLVGHGDITEASFFEDSFHLRLGFSCYRNTYTGATSDTPTTVHLYLLPSPLSAELVATLVALLKAGPLPPAIDRGFFACPDCDVTLRRSVPRCHRCGLEFT